MKLKYLLFVTVSILLFSCGRKNEIRTSSVFMPDGKEVKVFHLTNKSGMSAEVMEYGAILLSLKTADREGEFKDIVAGYDSVESYFGDQSYFGCIVGRYANRISGGKFSLDNREYNLIKNEKNINHLHGGLSGFNRKIWKGKPQISGGSQSVEFSYKSADAEEGYPGNLSVTVRYLLNDSNELHIEYKGETDKATVINLTNHSYFNLSGDFESGILNHHLKISADSFLTVDKNLIPAGKPVSVINSPFDFRNSKTVGYQISMPDSQLILTNGGFDHNYVLTRNKQDGGVQKAARLYDPQSGRIMEVYTDQPGLQLYTGNFLKGDFAGKGGIKYQKYAALTLETQNYPDAPNQPGYPSAILRPGEVYQHHTILKFRIDNEKQVYTNPIIDTGLPDPNIKYADGFYYLFATGKAPDGRHIPIYRSPNLTEWEFVRGAVERGGKTDWNYRNFWAPEVYEIGGKFYLYYTASPEISPSNSGNRVGLAISDKIEGPYRNSGIVVPHASIDGHVFFEKDSTMYIFYTIENLNKDGLKAGQIYADQLISPSRVAGKPVRIIGHHRWQEGPFILKRDNVYYLTYSCGAWTNSTYHVRYATASSVLGPYTEQPDTVLKSNKMVKGPGHHSFFTDKKGKDWIVYHGWDTAHTERYSRIDRIFAGEGKITSDGPTFTPQSVNK